MNHSNKTKATKETNHINTMSWRNKKCCNRITEHCLMTTRRILVILIILYQHTILPVNGRMDILDNYNLFQDFLEAKKLNFGIFTTCGHTNDIVESKIIANLKKTNSPRRISFSVSFANLHKLVSKDSLGSGIYLNLKCKDSENILKLASTNKLFNIKFKWLIVRDPNNGSIKGEQEIMEILENLDINLDSNVNVALEG